MSEIRKIIKFYSQSCSPCRIIAPIIEEIWQDMWIVIEEVDVHEHPDYATHYWVSALPTVIIMNEDWYTVKAIWAKPKSDYELLIKECAKWQTQ